MTKELEALLTELYVLIDDQVVEPRLGRGRRPELSDSELLCLAVVQMLLGFHSERRWVRHAQGNPDLRRMFPYMPQQPRHVGEHSPQVGVPLGVPDPSSLTVETQQHLGHRQTCLLYTSDAADDLLCVD